MSIPQEIASWPWAGMAATALGSGVVASGVTHFLKERSSTAERARAARDTALRAARAFEDYAHEMANVAAEWREWDMETAYQQSRRGFATLPAIDGLDWKSVDLSAMTRAFGFAGQHTMSASMVSAYFSDDDESGADLMVAQALSLGLAAWGIAVALRQAHGLPKAISVLNSYDFVEWMSTEKARRETIEQERWERHRAFVQTLKATNPEHEL